MRTRVWCVEIKEGDEVIDQRICSNANKAYKWIEYAKKLTNKPRDELNFRTYELPWDSWEWAPKR